MQAWHCITIILITVALFIYGTFRNEVERHVYEQEVETFVSEEGKSDQPLKKKDPDSNTAEARSSAFMDSPAWAEYEILLNCESEDMAFLHAQSLKGKEFLEFVTNKILESKTATELIFSPFRSDFFIENEKGILRSLYSAHTQLEDESIVLVVCRGHSARSSRLLATLLMDTYRLALQKETADMPLAEKLQARAKEILELKERTEKLKEGLSEEKFADEKLNVEAIAIRSEIEMLDQEFDYYKKQLLQVEEMFNEGKKPSEFLAVDGFADFGSIKEVKGAIDNLEAILRQGSLDPLVAEEVRKNVKDNQILLENEIAGAIQDLKEKSISGMQRKKILSNRLIDLQKKEDLKNGPARKYQVLSELEIEMERKASEYAALYTAWKKNRFSVVSMDIREK